MARPRSFENDEVLARAVEQFWRHGFEATSVADLARATGLSSSSLYNAFGSKHDLYLAALDAYLAQARLTMYGPMAEGDRGLEDVERFFEQLEAGLLQPGRPPGCLATNALAELAATAPQVRTRVTRFRLELQAAFGAALARAEVLGEAARVPPRLAQALAGLTLSANLLGAGGAEADDVRSVISAARELIAALPSS